MEIASTTRSTTRPQERTPPHGQRSPGLLNLISTAISSKTTPTKTVEVGDTPRCTSRCSTASRQQNSESASLLLNLGLRHSLLFWWPRLCFQEPVDLATRADSPSNPSLVSLAVKASIVSFSPSMAFLKALKEFKSTASVIQRSMRSS